jgi:hypothetical protein
VAHSWPQSILLTVLYNCDCDIILLWYYWGSPHTSQISQIGY